jgi:hypothetical protein
MQAMIMINVNSFKLKQVKWELLFILSYIIKGVINLCNKVTLYVYIKEHFITILKVGIPKLVEIFIKFMIVLKPNYIYIKKNILY